MKKTIGILIILSIFVNIFANFPFVKLFAEDGIYSKNTEEIVLNKDYYDPNDDVIGEITTDRSEYGKVYKKSDNLYESYIYNRPVHYLDESNNLVEINSTFEENGNELDSASIDYKLKIPKKIHSNKKIKLQYENTKIEITYNSINKVEAKIIESKTDRSNLNHLVGKVMYTDIFDNVDLELITDSISLKENIIINKYIKDFSFSYTLSITNLTLVETTSSIDFYNDNNELIYKIDKYFMYDSDGNISYDIEMNVELIKNNEYLITITPSSSWLELATYPVVIDPTVTYTLNTSPTKIEYKQITKTLTSTTNNFTIQKYNDNGTDISKYVIINISIQVI